MLRHWQREYLADFKLAFEDLGARKGGLELKDKEGVGKDWGGAKVKETLTLLACGIDCPAHTPPTFVVSRGFRSQRRVAGISGRDDSDV